MTFLPLLKPGEAFDSNAFNEPSLSNVKHAPVTDNETIFIAKHHESRRLYISSRSIVLSIEQYAFWFISLVEESRSSTDATQRGGGPLLYVSVEFSI